MFGFIQFPELPVVSVIALMVFDPANFPDLRKSPSLAIRTLMMAINECVKCTIERTGGSTPVDQASTF